MRTASFLTSLIGLTIATCAQAADAPAPPASKGDAEANKATMERLTAATQLGPQHAALAKYLGRWDVDISLPRMTAHSKGTAEYSWVIEGRWLTPTRHVTEVWDLGGGETPVPKVTFTFTKAQ